MCQCMLKISRLRPSGLGNFQLFSRRKARALQPWITDLALQCFADLCSPCICGVQVGPNQNPNEA